VENIRKSWLAPAEIRLFCIWPPAGGQEMFIGSSFPGYENLYVPKTATILSLRKQTSRYKLSLPSIL
jgi:hypothetical protein